MLRFEDVSFAYGGRAVLDGAGFELPRAGMAALIGPNGAGKTTLLQLACRTLRPSGGRIELAGAELAAIPRLERARRIALVPQALPIPFAFTVRELVGLGRTPYLRALRGEQDSDRAAVARALELTGTAGLAERSVLELSGGERQRVILAMALAQEPELLLLDEPTANLDVAHQLAMLELVGRLNREQGLTVLAAIHDLNLAALFFERLLVLDRGRIRADGRPAEVLTAPLVEDVYGAPASVVDHPTEGVPLLALSRSRR
jgi:iron complex transport system ATP-binding protein